MGFGRRNRRNSYRPRKRRGGIKSWIKLIIAGVIMFFIGGIIIGYSGLGSDIGSWAMILSFLGVVLTVVGIIIGIHRGYRRMLNE